MSESGAGVPPRALVGALLRRGVLHDRTEQATEDPGGLERLGGASLARAWRYVALGPMLYRIAAFPKVFIGFATDNGTTGLAPVLSATVFAVLANVAAVVWIVRHGGLRAASARRTLHADLALGLALNLVIAATAPASVQPFAVDVSWTWLVGTIAMWTSLFGVWRTIWLLVLAVPVRMLLTVAGGLPLTEPLALNRSVGCLVGLVVAVVTMTGFLVLVGIGGRFALTVGIRHGEQVERGRTRRMMHDTVLQTLDALAMATPGDETDPAARLSELRSVLGGEAAALRRRIMEQPPAANSRGFVAELADVVTEMAGHGLRTQLVAADVDDDVLSEARRSALREAVREAMRNAAKHAGTNQIVLRVEERDGGIAAVVRDHGVGFDVRDRPPGFGITQSIVARLSEVDGHGTVDSRPGHGTRVTMWVPRVRHLAPAPRPDR